MTPRALARALEAVREAPGIVPGLRQVDDLVAAARGAGTSSVPALTAAVHDGADQLTAMGAVHALGALPASAGHPVLVGLLRDGPDHLREHAAWALGAGPAATGAVVPLLRMVAEGGVGGMLAQRTLERWARRERDAVRPALVAAIAGEPRPDARARLVETLGLVPGAYVTALLVEHAADAVEHPAVRAAAVAALGDRPDASPGAGPGADAAVAGVLDLIASGDDALAEVARTALFELRLAADPLLAAAPPSRADESARHADEPAGASACRDLSTGSRGLTVVQLFLHADVDAGLTNAGRGDNGGIATLLVQLGDALAAQPGIDRVVTVSRGTPAAGTASLEGLHEPGHHYARVPLWGPPPHQARAWPLRVAVRRGIRRILRAAGPVDVLHLRMADVGSMAAAEVARELGIPVVFTLAPDPQALVAAREAAGTLSRADLGAADHAEHLLLRDRLVRRLAGGAAHLVLFPRPELEHDLHALLGVELADPTVRATVVAEGVDLDAIARARTSAEAATCGGDALPPPALAELDALLGALPPDRRHLPLVVSVGRLHRVKGMATLVQAWADGTGLRERCNLLVVGGDLDEPSDDEAAELDRIAATVPPQKAADSGLLLAGHRPNATVALWLAAARTGRPGLAAPHGAYACASLKEEFGIAVLEAMSAGLVAVAPAGGGPATYVEDGVTGILIDTTSPVALADAVTRALTLAGDADAVRRADRSRVVLREAFGIGTMASALERVYASVTGGAALALVTAARAGSGAGR